MSEYRTTDGDMVDAICTAHYGTETMTTVVYEANPGLAALGLILPMGVLIELPETSTQNVSQPIRLWG